MEDVEKTQRIASKIPRVKHLKKKAKRKNSCFEFFRFAFSATALRLFQMRFQFQESL
jgi:hypothetical protein